MKVSQPLLMLGTAKVRLRGKAAAEATELNTIPQLHPIRQLATPVLLRHLILVVPHLAIPPMPLRFNMPFQKAIADLDLAPGTPPHARCPSWLQAFLAAARGITLKGGSPIPRSALAAWVTSSSVCDSGWHCQSADTAAGCGCWAH